MILGSFYSRYMRQSRVICFAFVSFALSNVYYQRPLGLITFTSNVQDLSTPFRACNMKWLIINISKNVLGGEGEIRTHDLLFAKQLLYLTELQPLSTYIIPKIQKNAPVFCFFSKKNATSIFCQSHFPPFRHIKHLQFLAPVLINFHPQSIQRHYPDTANILATQTNHISHFFSSHYGISI